MRITGVVAAVLSAVAFGVSAPVVQRLGAGLSAVLVAGLLYGGSGVGLLVLLLRRRARGDVIAPLPPQGRVSYAAAIALGGVLAPALLVAGLASTTAATASLLLNLEGVATATLAWLVFREHTSARVVVGMGFIVAAGVVLSGFWTGTLQTGIGGVYVVGACLCWAADNNLTRGVSSADPMWLSCQKGLVAGAVNLTLAVIVGGAVPSAVQVASLLVVGVVCYGASLLLYVVALGSLGTARTGAWFSVAPFVGAALAIAWGEPVTTTLLVAAALMAVGLWLHATEAHAHEHAHEALEHEHEHTHDDGHHGHEHPPGVDVTQPHTHRHVHAPLVHTHAHVPDLHHRHTH